jgi:polyisoprenoid-binding protein YceI
MQSILAFALWIPLLLSSSAAFVYTYSIEDESWISISGSSNVNTFECYSNSKFSKGNIYVVSDDSDNSLNFTNASLSLGILSFDCKNPIMNKDFYRTLGAEKNPSITIELIDAIPIYHNESNSTQFGRVKATIAVTLNNKCKIIELPIDWQKINHTSYRVSGTKEINMTDFGITPPSPAFGLIKVHNQISINFSMLVRANLNFDPKLLGELTK